MPTDRRVTCSCGRSYPALGDGDGGWTWHDGLSAPPAFCKPCARRCAEQKHERDTAYAAEVLTWAATLSGRDRADLERHAASTRTRASGALPYPFPLSPGYRAFCAWRNERAAAAFPASSLAASPAEAVTVQPAPVEAQRPSERAVPVRRRRSDVR